MKWDVSSDQLTVDVLKHRDEVKDIVFSPDGKLLASGSDDYTARIWDVETGEQVGEPLKHEYYVNAVVFTPDGKTLITGDDGEFLNFWDVKTGTTFRRFTGVEQRSQTIGNQSRWKNAGRLSADMMCSSGMSNVASRLVKNWR